MKSFSWKITATDPSQLPIPMGRVVTTTSTGDVLFRATPAELAQWLDGHDTSTLEPGRAGIYEDKLVDAHGNIVDLPQQVMDSIGINIVANELLHQAYSASSEVGQEMFFICALMAMKRSWGEQDLAALKTKLEARRPEFVERRRRLLEVVLRAALELAEGSAEKEQSEVIL